MKDFSDLGKRIKEARIRLGLSQAALAERTGLSQTSINFWENGKRVPKSSSLLKLAPALDLAPQELTQYLIGEEQMMFGREGGDSPADSYSPKGNRLADDRVLHAEDRSPLAALKDDFAQLNDEGQVEALKRLHELTLIPSYQRHPSK